MTVPFGMSEDEWNSCADGIAAYMPILDKMIKAKQELENRKIKVSNGSDSL